MLKSGVVYDVTIVLNDGQEMQCLLLSKPDALTLAAIAEAKSADAEMTEALTFARGITTPTDSSDGEETEITVAGTVIGTVTVVPLPAFYATKKRGRKPATTTAPDTPDVPDIPDGQGGRG